MTEGGGEVGVGGIREGGLFETRVLIDDLWYIEA